MASPVNQHCANCIDTLSLSIGLTVRTCISWDGGSHVIEGSRDPASPIGPLLTCSEN